MTDSDWLILAALVVGGFAGFAGGGCFVATILLNRVMNNPPPLPMRRAPPDEVEEQGFSPSSEKRSHP